MRPSNGAPGVQTRRTGMLSMQPDGSRELNRREPFRQVPRALDRLVAGRHLDAHAFHALFHQHLTSQPAARA
jgi:hypothetical protein